jgi:hypothetical protein
MTAKVTKLKLAIDHESDYVLLGLACAEPDYKLSLALNKKLGISLRNIPGIKPDDMEQVFSRYSNSSRTESFVFNLISNRSGNIFLLNKLKNIDFLLQIQDYDEEAEIEKITAELRKIEGVTGVFKIDISTLKDKNLVYLAH